MRLILRLAAACAFGARALAQDRCRDSRQFERERGAFVFAGALGKDAAAVPLGDRAHDVEAEARALHLRPERLEAVEAVENAPELGAGNADAGDP